MSGEEGLSEAASVHSPGCLQCQGIAMAVSALGEERAIMSLFASL